MGYLQVEYGLSIRRGCAAIKLSSSVYYYQATERNDDELPQALDQLAEQYPRWGFWKMYWVLSKQGYPWNHKRLHRVYVAKGMNIRRKRKRRLPARVKEPMLYPISPNICWSMDFMQDSLIYGKTFRTFNVIDDFNREALCITIDTSISSKRVIRELHNLIDWRGKPRKLRVDNGPEFLAHAMAEWCQSQGIELKFIEAGKPVQNSFIERFNKSYRNEILDAYLFESLDQVKTQTQEWIWTYNNKRPHDSLMKLTPVEFLLKYGKVLLPTALPDFPTFQQEFFFKNYENSLSSTVAK